MAHTYTLPPSLSLILITLCRSLSHSLSYSVSHFLFLSRSLSLYSSLSFSLSDLLLSFTLSLLSPLLSLSISHSLFQFLSLLISIHSPFTPHLFLICSALFYSYSLPPFLFNTFVVYLSLSLSLPQFSLSFFLLIYYLSFPCSCLSVHLSVSAFLRIYFSFLIPEFLPQLNSLYISLFLLPSHPFFFI